MCSLRENHHVMWSIHMCFFFGTENVQLSKLALRNRKRAEHRKHTHRSSTNSHDLSEFYWRIGVANHINYIRRMISSAPPQNRRAWARNIHLHVIGHLIECCLVGVVWWLWAEMELGKTCENANNVRIMTVVSLVSSWGVNCG